MIRVDPAGIKHVHVVFKTHFDFGFTDFAGNVRDRFFEEFFPQAIAIGRTLRETGSDRLVWTTGSWLMYEYLEYAKGKALSEAEEAIEHGDLAWHGIPFTFHSELCEPSLFEYGLSLSKQLDARFGKKTIAAKMTDVPGHTRGIVPLLANAGIRFLHLGRNQASKPPEVPEAFRWRHTDGSEIVVVYHHDYGYDSVVEGMDSAISFVHGRDNHPPQDADEVRASLARLRKKFPNAKVKAARLDTYARKLWAYREHLPVVDGELADTWIYGIGSHPERVQRYLALARLRRKWLDKGVFDDVNNDSHARFSRSLMCVPEHTWGIMVDKLEDTTSYEGHAFASLRRSSRGKQIEASWQEQMDYIEDAVAALGRSKLSKEAVAELEKTKVVKPKRGGKRVRPGQVTDGPRFSVGFDQQTGAINHLVDHTNGRTWADSTHTLGLFQFENFSRADFDRFMRQYNPQPVKCAWAPFVMTKFGMDAEREINHGDWLPVLDDVTVRETVDGLSYNVRLKLPDEAVKRFGCPELVENEIAVSEEGVKFTLQWFNKSANRLPAACWLTFQPKTTSKDGWKIRKMGQWIWPFEVVRFGNRKLHAIEEVRYADSQGGLSITPLDSPLMAPGQRSLLDFNQRQPEMNGGVHFNLWNNVWNTNFRYWHEGDCKFRFEMDLTGA